MRTERISIAQTRPEIVRIGNPIEHQEQRRLRGLRKDVVHRQVRQCLVDDCDDALMATVPRERIEPRCISRVQGHASGARSRRQLAARAILAATQHVERMDGLRSLTQAGGDGVEAEEGSGGGQEVRKR